MLADAYVASSILSAILTFNAAALGQRSQLRAPQEHSSIECLEIWNAYLTPSGEPSSTTCRSTVTAMTWPRRT
ncbi:hypothetical protein C8R45DRAFT_996434 [Mycena sanguinolenta]|nr:hypothetical protein C8R45DRAFT_996434 [Mycena sanguinolenta]